MKPEGIVETKFSEWKREQDEHQRQVIANGAFKGIIDAQAEQIATLRARVAELEKREADFLAYERGRDQEVAGLRAALAHEKGPRGHA